MPRIEAGFCIDSTARPENMIQDAVYCNEKKKIYAVLDGVGGSLDGRYAACFVRDRMEQRFSKNGIDIPKSLQSIDFLLYAKTKRNGESAQTALALLHFKGNEANYASIGDSRVYLLRQWEITKMTEDDNQLMNLSPEIRKVVAANLDAATSEDDLSVLEKEYWKLRKHITRALGAGYLQKELPGFEKTVTQSGDIWILITDGILNLTTEQIKQIVLECSEDPKEAATALVSAAKLISLDDCFRSECDDMTALVVKVL